MKLRANIPILVAALAVSATPLLAEKSPGEHYKALLGEFNAAMNAYSQAYRAAKTNAERETIRNEQAPKPEDFSAKFLKLAEQHPDDAAAVDALVWIATRGYQTKESHKAYELLARDHVASSKTAQVVRYAPHTSAPAAGKFLQGVLEKGSTRELKAQAAQSLYAHAQKQGSFTADKYLKLLVDEFADVNAGRETMGAFAKKELDHNKTFGLGKTAPEIEGEDIDGVEFKLSDYRGKVVVIDFWGDW